MRTIVITGGTDGMGRGLGLHYLKAGERVVAIASGQPKGDAFLADAARLGAAERATFLRADLSTIAGIRSAVAAVQDRTDSVDALVFAAQRFRPAREETADGLEFTFALMYLSRYLLGHGLADHLEKAPAPVVMNIAGPGGLPGTVHWDDLQLHRKYSGMRASMQASRTLDLLGVSFSRDHPDSRTRYVLYNPGFVATGMADPLNQPWRALTKAAAAVLAMPAAKAIVPIAALIDAPPEAPLAAFMRTKPVPITGTEFDPGRADRLRRATEDILATIGA